MPNITSIKPTFAGGEYSPSLYSRVDLALYQKGAKTLRNMIVHPHGGASNRPGTEYKAQGKYSDRAIRLIPFEFSTLQTYVIEFGHYYCRFYTNGAQIELSDADAWVTTVNYVIGDYVKESSTIYYCITDHTSGTFATDLAAGYWTAQTILEVPTPYSESDLPNINYTQSADVLFLVHPDYQPRMLERLSATSWVMESYNFLNGPFQIANIDTDLTLEVSDTSGNATLTPTGFLIDSLQVGGLYVLQHYVEGQAITVAKTSTGTTSSISCGGTWRIITHGTWTGTIRIEKSTDGGSNWTMLREFSSADDFNADTYGTEDMSDYASPFLVRINMTAYTSGTCNINLTTDPFYQEGICQIDEVAVDGTSAQVTITRDFASTDATPDWSEGSWSDYRGWPSAIEFHQEDRLVFCNTYTEPQTYWMTKTGDYYNFARSNPLVDSDAISSPIPGRKVNGINNLIPLTEMIALTTSSEWSIRSTSGTAITPTTVTNRVHGYEGAAAVKPVVIGNRGIFVQALSTLIRDIGYELASDSFTGSDLSILANHLFSEYSIVEMAYQQNPDRLLWVVRSDGKLLSMTYMREQEVVAWTWHDTNEGEDLYESVCTIAGSGYNELWLVVNRNGTRFIERMVRRMSSALPEEQFFMDCGITYRGSPTDVIAGLDHLIGKEVCILADGNVVNKQTVDPDGQIYLEDPASIVHIGIPYNSDLETLNMELNLQDGTAQGRRMKVSKVVIRLMNSRGGYIGPDENTLYEFTTPYRATYDDPIELFSGDQKEVLGGGYSDGGRIFIRQSDPLPITILAIIPTITPGGMTNV